MMLWGIGGIFGYAAFGFLADALGRRPTIILYSLGTLVFGCGLYLGAARLGACIRYILPLFGFCVFGVFSGHAVYLPELFPTHMRAHGGRVLQRLRAVHHQLRAAGGRAAGRHRSAAISPRQRR